MSTRGRFRQYIELEEMVAERVTELADFAGQISRITPVEEGLFYDRVVVLEGGKEIKLEIQITEAKAWKYFGDVRLDLLSAFKRLPGSRFAGFQRIYPEEVDAFLESVRVQRLGKLYKSEADTLAFYVPEPVDLLWLFSMKALQNNVTYFTQKYGIMINRKSRDEVWESCFVAVKKTDPILDKCGVRYGAGAEASAQDMEPAPGELF